MLSPPVNKLSAYCDNGLAAGDIILLGEITGLTEI
jgi:hypothetical protein